MFQFTLNDIARILTIVVFLGFFISGVTDVLNYGIVIILLVGIMAVLLVAFFYFLLIDKKNRPE